MTREKKKKGPLDDYWYNQPAMRRFLQSFRADPHQRQSNETHAEGKGGRTKRLFLHVCFPPLFLSPLIISLLFLIIDLKISDSFYFVW